MNTILENKTQTARVAIYDHTNNKVERTNEMEVHSTEKGVFLVATGLDHHLTTDYTPVWENDHSMDIEWVDADFILFVNRIKE